jgi:amino acid transporter
VSETKGLHRVLTLRDVTLFYIVAVIGPRWIGNAAAAGPSSILLWVLACVGMFIPSAFTVLELSTRYPEEGGIYVWARETFGEFAGFMTGWLYWASNLVYFPGLLYFAAGNILFVGGPSWLAHSADPVFFIWFSLACLALALWVNIVGLEIGKHLNNIGAWATWLPIGLLVVAGMISYVKFGSATSFTLSTMLPHGGITTVAFWSTLAFGFGGLESASIMGDEIHDTRRTIPRAIFVAGISIIAVYVLGTVAALVAIPASEMTSLQGIMQAIDRALGRTGLGLFSPFAAFMISLGSIGGVGAWMACMSRLPFVAGVDKALPPAFAKLHPKWGTPVFALVVQALIAGGIAVLGQAGTSVRNAYTILVNLGVISFFIPYAIMYCAMIRAQWLPAGPEVRTVPGGRPVGVLLGALGLTTVLVSIVLSCLPPADDPHPTLAVIKVVGSSLTMIVIGAGLFLVGRYRGRASVV